MTQIRVAECIPADQKGSTMNAAEKAEALTSIRQDVGAFGLGLVLGAAACYFVRPKGKATNAFMMAQRWLAWGLLGGVSSAVSFYSRNHDKGGILGALIGLVFFAGVAWGLGYVWGLIKFAGSPTTQAAASPAATNTGPKPLSSMAFLGLLGLAILAVVVVSGIKSGSGDEAKKWWEEPGAVERAQREAGVGTLEMHAEDGDPFAQVQLGQNYLWGRDGKEIDTETGFAWMKKAADQGYSDGIWWVATCYGLGLGVKKDEKKAADVYEQLADGGLVKAQRSLGFCYKNGLGREKSWTRALEWFLKAAEQGDALAQLEVGRAYLDGNVSLFTTLYPEKKPSTELGTDKQEGAAWILKAAEQGNEDAQWEIAHLYHTGEGVAKDGKKRVYWLTKLAQQGYAEAQFALAREYLSGNGVVTDAKAAMEWQLKAANQGHARAQIGIALLYAEGRGVIKDIKAALAWSYVAKAHAENEAKDMKTMINGVVERYEAELGTERSLQAQELAKTLISRNTTTAATN